jgi:hypothetical protein
LSDRKLFQRDGAFKGPDSCTERNRSDILDITATRVKESKGKDELHLPKGEESDDDNDDKVDEPKKERVLSPREEQSERAEQETVKRLTAAYWRYLRPSSSSEEIPFVEN